LHFRVQSAGWTLRVACPAPRAVNVFLCLRLRVRTLAGLVPSLVVRCACNKGKGARFWRAAVFEGCCLSPCPLPTPPPPSWLTQPPPPPCLLTLVVCSCYNLVWVVNFSLELYRPLRTTRSLAKWYHLFVWTVSGVTAVLIVTAHSFGYTA
jgi:hypothetical protein